MLVLSVQHSVLMSTDSDESRCMRLEVDPDVINNTAECGGYSCHYARQVVPVRHRSPELYHDVLGSNVVGYILRS